MLQQNHQPLPPPPPPANADTLNLSNVLHFLQTEWRRYERDRNEWEIERAEMRARIALLEGERRSFENVKLDLMRRIKMLEHALRIERAKQLSQPQPPAPPHVKVAQAQAHGNAPLPRDDASVQKEEGTSSSPRSDDSPLPADPRLSITSLPPMVNGTAAGSVPKGQSWTSGQSWGVPNGSAAVLAGKPPPGRDPKSRARSRDYLKQCLQEVSYLTSQQAMNPLPNRPLLANPSLQVSLPNLPTFDQHPFNGRPRKTVPDVGPNGTATANPTLERGATLNAHQQQVMDDKDKEQEDEPQQLFRPEDDWKEPAMRAGQPTNNGPMVSTSGAASWDQRREDDDEAAMGKDEDDENDVDDVAAVEGEAGKTWKARRTLRNHLDAVRALAFHPNELCLATGGDDFAIKIWRIDVPSLASNANRASTEIEPQLTMRGHSASISKLVQSPVRRLLYSASLDSTIRVWSMPPASMTTYSPYDPARHRGILEGHTDAVWDLALVRDETMLISCGADGAVKVWDVGGPAAGALRLSWGYNGLASEDDAPHETIGATALEAIKTDLRKVAVAFTDGAIKLFDLDSGRLVGRLQFEANHEDASETLVNKLVSHPTMPLLVSAHDDRSIRLFDITSGQCTHTMPAHRDAVTSLSIDSAGFLLASGGHDCSVRFWDLVNTRACVFETSAHREKGHEGVLAVEFHPKLPFLATAGADGVVKLYASS